MSDSTITNIINEIDERGSLDPDHIPELDLYMDQIMTLFDQYLGAHKRNDNDKIITKTMINNYSKEGVLKPIKGKKYTKEHIIELLVIYSLKNTITIQEIKRLMEPVREKEIAIEPIYQNFLDVMNPIIEAHSKNLINLIEENYTESPEDLLSILLIICSISNYYESIAEKIIDTFYPEIKK